MSRDKLFEYYAECINTTFYEAGCEEDITPPLQDMLDNLAHDWSIGGQTIPEEEIEPECYWEFGLDFWAQVTLDLGIARENLSMAFPGPQ